jgi:hypothetical protein
MRPTVAPFQKDLTMYQLWYTLFPLRISGGNR